jgi:hypothetical protein
MKYASIKYSQALSKQFRDPAYGLVSIGVVNKPAQRSATISKTFYLSDNKSALSLGESIYGYASFEENQTKADGNSFFPPEDDEYLQIKLNMECVASDILGPVRVTFDKSYDLKGFTFDFTDSYPTEFTISNGTTEVTYENNSRVFTTFDNFNNSTYIEITPIHFVNGDNKRMRFNYILMGVGLSFDNKDIVDISFKESVSYVSEELPSISVTVKVFNGHGIFNVDDTNSFINYLSDGQELDIMLGQTLDNGKIEYVQMPTT